MSERLSDEQLRELHADNGFRQGDAYATGHEVRLLAEELIERRAQDLSIADRLSLQYVHDLVEEMLRDRRPDRRATDAQRFAWRRTAEANQVLDKLLATRSGA